MRSGLHCPFSRTFMDPDPHCTHFGSQPRVELIAPDEVEGICSARRNRKSPPFKIEMYLRSIDVLADIQTQPAKEQLGIDGQPAGAELVPRIAVLLKDEDARDELRSTFGEVQGSGKISQAPPRMKMSVCIGRIQPQTKTDDRRVLPWQPACPTARLE
jgi:hypothetical protein